VGKRDEEIEKKDNWKCWSEAAVVLDFIKIFIFSLFGKNKMREMMIKRIQFNILSHSGSSD
jgi:hypothetical protein